MNWTAFFVLVFGVCWQVCAVPIYNSSNITEPRYKRALPSVAPSLPNPNSGIFERSLTRVIQSQAKNPNHEFFEQVHDGLMRAWRAQVEVRRYWEVVEEIKSAQAIEVGAGAGAGLGVKKRQAGAGAETGAKQEQPRQLGSWPQDEKYQWRSNCEWLMNVSRRLTSVFKLPVGALSIFPDATPRYCVVK